MVCEGGSCYSLKSSYEDVRRMEITDGKGVPGSLLCTLSTVVDKHSPRHQANRSARFGRETHREGKAETRYFKTSGGGENCLRSMALFEVQSRKSRKV